ncbi:MAG: hypothetical protein CL908_03115 [Deltaproteobacteria bacterium]|jgi:protein-S-isoprenylcysteine O-methyltransferase Ste14|nr:hypothetical protein [Deltaproteobacteria bacterium]
MGKGRVERGRRPLLQRVIRASTTRSTAALWGKSALNALLFFAIFAVALPAAAHWALPLQLPIPGSLGVGLAVLLFLAGLAGWIWGLDAFSRRGRGTPLALDAPRHLVTEGPFAWCRNPIMVSELAVIWAVAFTLRSLGAAVYAAALTVLAHWLVSRVEEPELRARFEAAYEAYCERVPRWIPRVGPARRD